MSIEDIVYGIYAGISVFLMCFRVSDGIIRGFIIMGIAEGADSVSLINTLMGMAVDIEKRQPLLSIRTGGLSGPCVKPVALRMVYDVAHAVKIPVVGLGGISTAKDAIEFLMCGATAIEIGTANFVDPAVTKKVKDGINDWLDQHGCTSVHEIIGAIK